MIWPFNKKPRRKNPPAIVSADDAADSFYVSRPRVEKVIADAWAQDKNLVIYGPSHQGKTMLLARHLSATNSIYIECRPDFKRTQIYRVALSSLGYAVMVEKKRRGKASTTVKFGIASTGVEASAEGELEQVMQSITVDLKNPSEVAHLISRIKHPPRLVLNNFQLLDNGTKKNLLFDMAFFAERRGIRTVIVGTWANEEYLEEIEPAVTGKFRYVLVPTWSDAELRAAAACWTAHSKASGAIAPHLDEFLELAAGDVSLFRTLVEGSIDNMESAPSQTTTSTAASTIQTKVLGRFQRGLATKLKAIFEQRDTYLTYFSLESASLFEINSKFKPIPGANESAYVRTAINPDTKQPYSDGRAVLLDQSGNPQYLERRTGEVVTMNMDIVRFLLKMFHAAVQQGSNKIKLAILVHELADQLLPKPIAVDESRLKAVFARLGEVQRQALIVPHLLALDNASEIMEIVDRRFFLFLKSVSLEDLEELIDDALPRTAPKSRRHSHVSPMMTTEQKAAYIAQVMFGSELTESPDKIIEDEQDGAGEQNDSQLEDKKEQ